MGGGVHPTLHASETVESSHQDIRDFTMFRNNVYNINYMHASHIP